MKKITTLSLMVMSLLSASVALAISPNNVKVPKNDRGQEAYSDNVGWLHVRDSATSELVVCSGKCLLRAVILNTGPATSRLQIRNTSVADGSGVLVLGDHHFQVINTAPGNNPIAAPILLDKGISVTLSSVSAGEEVTVEYRDLN